MGAAAAAATAANGPAADSGEGDVLDGGAPAFGVDATVTEGGGVGQGAVSVSVSRGDVSVGYDGQGGTSAAAAAGSVGVTAPPATLLTFTHQLLSQVRGASARTVHACRAREVKTCY